MKVMTILGSARKNGNSEKSLGFAIESMRNIKPELTQIRLSALNPILHCTGCNGCRTNGKKECILKDNLAELIRQVRDSDSILIACPIYFFGFNSLTKAFFDRAFYSSIGSDKEYNMLKSKRIGLILTFADTDIYESGAINAINTFKDIAKYMEMKVEGIVYGQTIEKKGPNGKMADECKALGEKMCK